jgi:hypothetical protein
MPLESSAHENQQKQNGGFMKTSFDEDTMRPEYKLEKNTVKEFVVNTIKAIMKPISWFC